MFDSFDIYCVGIDKCFVVLKWWYKDNFVVMRWFSEFEECVE